MIKLEERMRRYEKAHDHILIPGLPVLARMDGRSFHTFTKHMERPFHQPMSKCMEMTTHDLVEETGAIMGYTQSDEITLLWFNPEVDSDNYFGSRHTKIVTTLSALATVFFNKRMREFLDTRFHGNPTFDARVFQVPNREEAHMNFLWRENDATKNSVSMAAQHYYSEKQLFKKSTSVKIEMLYDAGIKWAEYPAFFKRGLYIRRQTEKIKFTSEEIDKLPPLHAARKNPNLEFERRKCVTLDVPPLGTIRNGVDFIFGAEPVKF